MNTVFSREERHSVTLSGGNQVYEKSKSFLHKQKSEDPFSSASCRRFAHASRSQIPQKKTDFMMCGENWDTSLRVGVDGQESKLDVLLPSNSTDTFTRKIPSSVKTFRQRMVSQIFKEKT